MRRKLEYVLFILFSMILHLPVSALERAFEFDGVVNFEFSEPWGNSIDSNSPITGRFVYESNSPATHSTPACDCTGYRQQHINGFWADFGGVLVRADDYVIEIGNDVPQVPAGVADFFTIRFTSDIVPSLSSTLLVDGSEESTGVFSLTFAANLSSLYSDSSLPSNIVPSDFTSQFTNILSDTPDPPFDVIYSVDQFQGISTLRSDHDLNHRVDGIDFLILQRNYGKATQNGDADSNVFIDVSDLSAWEIDYTNTLTLSEPSHVIPEPKSVALLTLVALFSSSSVMRQINHTEFPLTNYV